MRVLDHPTKRSTSAPKVTAPIFAGRLQLSSGLCSFYLWQAFFLFSPASCIFNSMVQMYRKDASMLYSLMVFPPRTVRPIHRRDKKTRRTTSSTKNSALLRSTLSYRDKFCSHHGTLDVKERTAGKGGTHQTSRTKPLDDDPHVAD